MKKIFLMFLLSITIFANWKVENNVPEENEEVAAINEEVETLKEIRDLLKQK